MKTEKLEDWGEELSEADGGEVGKGNGDKELMNTNGEELVYAGYCELFHNYDMI